MTPRDRRILARVRELLDGGRARGVLDRRDFLRLSTLGVGTAVLSACNSAGPERVQSLLTGVGRFNERVERWLFDRERLDPVSPQLRAAGSRFPAYHVADQTPVWDASTMGEWRLRVEGAVRAPLSLSLAELRALPVVTQRHHHYCVEGWTAVAAFGGVALSTLARMAQPTSDAGYVDFQSFDDGYHESWDTDSALHPQTLIVLAKDGGPLHVDYGAPARLHGPVKLGYKNTKYLTRIVFIPERNGGYWSDRGYEWYGGT
ncbi:MAG: molybdopterin-dependent oxidoreductase [Gemmatimonadaceae bacterium]|jgi:DMSO/TMAO reductase YedYZ molybdopterin-dependent catalytic subunit|nr:molybdopterin-dependent oxidoreductase [Gemmatimonadaceae bacterium]